MKGEEEDSKKTKRMVSGGYLSFAFGDRGYSNWKVYERFGWKICDGANSPTVIYNVEEIII